MAVALVAADVDPNKHFKKKGGGEKQTSSFSMKSHLNISIYIFSTAEQISTVQPESRLFAVLSSGQLTPTQVELFRVLIFRN